LDLDKDQWQRLKALLTQALDLPSHEREPLLNRALADEPDLRQHALELLPFYDGATRSVGPTTSPDAVADNTTVGTIGPGSRVGPYKVLRKLGQGGMGLVFLAEDQRLGRQVALKVLSRTPRVSLIDSNDRLMDEARSAAVLNHPGIVTLHDVFDANGELVAVMEYVNGRSLGELIVDGPLPVGFALRLAVQLGDALSYAHGRGIIHCDLKPANIHVLPEGAPKILDFGLARAVARNSNSAHAPARNMFGTRGYMSPERLLGREPTAAGDVYALGVIVYQLLTGMPPFRTDDHQQLFFDTLTSIPIPPSARVPAVPVTVDAIVIRCLAKDPRDRLQPHELSREVKECLKVLDPFTSIEAFGSGDRLRYRPRQWLLPVTALSGVLILGIVVSNMTGTGSLPSLFQRDSPSADRVAALRPVTPVSVAILPMIGTLSTPTDTALGNALSSLLRAALARHSGLNVLLLDEPPLSSNATPEGLMRGLGSQFAVRCVLTSLGVENFVNVELWSSAGSEPRMQQQLAFDSSDIAATFQRVLEAVTTGLRREIPEQANAGVDQPSAIALVPAALALNHFAQGLQMLDRPDVPGNIDRAISLLESAAAKDPSSALILAALAQAHWSKFSETKDEEHARRATTAVLGALQLNNDLLPVRLSAAVIERGVGELERAERGLIEATQRFPSSDEARRLLGEVLSSRAQFQRAQIAFDEAIALRPNYWGNHRAKGLAYYSAGQFEQASESFRRVTELQPDSAWGFQMLGTAQHQLGRYEVALAAYKSALSLGPTPGAWANMGRIYFDTGDYVNARDAYMAALAIRAASPLTWRNLGDVLTAMGARPDAAHAYTQAAIYASRTLKVNSRDANTLSLLAVVHAKLMRFADALAEAERAVTLAPQDKTVHYRKAVVLKIARRTREAQAAMNQAIALGFSASEARLDPDLKGLIFADPVPR
jgi:serine/threonine protein kinase/tetratricopeptide (TPR) repeat protein